MREFESKLECGEIAEIVRFENLHSCFKTHSPSAPSTLERFSWPCRCGGNYFITPEEIDEGFDTVQCDGCSLYISILRAPLEQEEDADVNSQEDDFEREQKR